jgi:hypothetical protein
MLKSIKNISWLVLLAFGMQAAWGFSLLGPTGNGGDAWQTAVIGYPLPGDIGSPKNIGEGYRRNTPVLYYAYDANFNDYFGTSGMTAVDGAFAILNSLTNVDSYSSSLSEFPLGSQHANYRAQSLGLTDLKSLVLGVMVEELGLADPVQYTWTLHNRAHITGDPPCPLGMEYIVVQRNFGITASSLSQLQYSPYVNDVLYSYDIFEDCGPGNPEAITEPFSVDPLAQVDTAVAAFAGTFIDDGYFYTGLTRDDVAALRYLLTSNNIVTESPAAGSDVLTTNIGSTFVLSNLDLSVLSATALTNTPDILATLYPTLVIVSVTTNFTEVCTPNVISYLTNQIGSPAGSPQLFVVVTNGYNCSYQPVYTYSFGNVITNTFSTNSRVQLVTTSLGNQIGAPAGSPPITNIVTKSFVETNVPSGDYFIIPAGACGLDIISNSEITSGVTISSNVVTSATNANGFVSTYIIISSFTNHQYLAHPVICGVVASTPGLYEGIEHIQFVKADYDSLIGQFFQPITNDYTMTFVTNSQASVQHFQRVVVAPDVLFTARDTVGFAGGYGVLRSIDFNQANILPGLAGPGTIDPPVTVTLDSSAPFYENLSAIVGTPFVLSENNSLQFFAYGSFDASTNPPTVYPNGTSITNLQNQILIQISPTSLPDGTNNVPYPATTFTTSGGGAFSPPFTWSVLNSTPLPAGLTLSSGGTISGTPTNNVPGTYDFVIQMSDSLTPPRTVQWNYSITIY